MSRKSQSVRARRERGKRVESLNKRLFNNPLRVFIEIKYPSIYTEYTELFREMREAHPRRKNLLTSHTFRKSLGENTTTATPTEVVIDCYLGVKPTQSAWAPRIAWI